MTDEIDEWQKKQTEPLGLFDLANKWAEALKVVGAGNGAGLIAAGAALSTYSTNPSMVLWIKIGGAIFFFGVLTFALAFALLQLSIFAHDEMLHAIRKKEKDLATKQRKASSSAMIGANRLAALSALCFFIGLCVGFVAFLSFQGVPSSATPIRPASILLMPTCAIAASLVEQSLPHIFPNRVRPIELEGIQLLDFDGAKAADAFDPQHMARNFREPALLDRQRRPSSGARISQDRIP